MPRKRTPEQQKKAEAIAKHFQEKEKKKKKKEDEKGILESLFGSRREKLQRGWKK